MRKDSSSDSRSRQVEIADLPQALSTAIETASHSKEEERQWLEDVSFTKSINEDALMALLLPALPNLKTLDLTLGENVMYFSRMMQRASWKEKPFNTTPAFEKLSDVMYAQNRRVFTYYDEELENADRDDGEEEDEEEHPCYTVVPLSLPAVSRIFGLKSSFQVASTNQEQWVLPLAYGISPQLSHFELRECLLNSQAVVDLLQVPIALKTFIYEVTPETPDSGILNINIYRAMEYQMSSLENSWLDCVPWNKEFKRFLAQFDDAKPMPSFANFNNLRTLRIASPFIFGSIRRLRLEGKGSADLLAPLLPERLHTLHITRCDHNHILIEEQLEFLLLRLPNTLHLSKIIIEHPFTETLDQFPRTRELVELAEGKNISLIVVNAGPEHHADDMYDWKGLGIDESMSWTETACGDNCSFTDRVSNSERRNRR